MRKILLMSSALALLSGTTEAACIQTPSCSSLGYSSSSSCSGGTKCPWGNYWNCTAANNTSKITELTNKITTLETKVTEISKDAATANCKIGDILYSDMSCNTNVVASKTPIGVIFDTTNKLAIGLERSYQHWSTSQFDVPGLSNITSSSAVTADWQGKNNTRVVLDYCKANGKSCPAFEYVNTYKTEGTKEGDWYLPAMGELNAIYSNMNVLNKTLSKIGGTKVEAAEAFSFSSSEAPNNSFWRMYFGNGDIDYASKSSSGGNIRPVLAF